MFKWRNQVAAAAFGLAVGLHPSAGASQDIEVIMALPAQTLTFTSAFVAEDMGFYKQAGLKVSTRNLVGVAAPNAVLAGSADFTFGTGPVFLRAAAQGQRFLAIANMVDRPMVELVLRKDVAEAAGIKEGMSLADKAKALKGRTIAIQGVGSIIHAWMRYVAAKGGLDPEKDVTIAPMNPPAMLPALETKQVEGYTTSMPFTTQAVMKGQAVMLASAANGKDAPELIPFAYGLIYTRENYCKEKREVCVRMARAYALAAKAIHERPNEVFEKVLRKRFDKMDPALLAEAWKHTLVAHAKDVRVTVPQLENSQQVSLVAKLLEPKDALKSYDGLYTDEFLK